MARPAFSIVRSERDYTPADRARYSEDRGMAPRRVSGGYIDDLAVLGKAIMLCELRCERKFNPKAYGYATTQRIPVARGNCDGCGQFHERNRLFLPADQAVF